jgi:hypothetical protein
MTKPKLVGRQATVSPRALVGRINRHLAHENQMVRSPRGRGLNSNLGDYFIVDFNRNFIVATKVNIEELGREIGVLAQWEEMEAES